MTYRFKPLPDITVYEFAIFMANISHGPSADVGIIATDEQMQGNDPKLHSIPECLRRHFEKLPETPARGRPIRRMRKWEFYGSI